MYLPVAIPPWFLVPQVTPELLADFVKMAFPPESKSLESDLSEFCAFNFPGLLSLARGTRPGCFFLITLVL